MKKRTIKRFKNGILLLVLIYITILYFSNIIGNTINNGYDFLFIITKSFWYIVKFNILLLLIIITK